MFLLWIALIAVSSAVVIFAAWLLLRRIP